MPTSRELKMGKKHDLLNGLVICEWWLFIIWIPNPSIQTKGSHWIKYTNGHTRDDKTHRKICKKTMNQNEKENKWEKLLSELLIWCADLCFRVFCCCFFFFCHRFKFQTASFSVACVTIWRMLCVLTDCS